MLTFETETRYYSITIQPDLLGPLHVQCHWQGKHNQRADEEAKALIKKISQRRLRHGYQIMPQWHSH